MGRFGTRVINDAFDTFERMRQKVLDTAQQLRGCGVPGIPMSSGKGKL